LTPPLRAPPTNTARPLLLPGLAVPAAASLLLPEAPPNRYGEAPPPPWAFRYARRPPLLLPGGRRQNPRRKADTVCDGPSPPPWDRQHAVMASSSLPLPHPMRGPSSSLGQRYAAVPPPPPWAPPLFIFRPSG